MHILAINGSPRPSGNTNYLTDRALEAVSVKGATTEKIQLCQRKISPCIGHDPCGTYKKCKINDDIPEILEKFRTADALIMATPVYYYYMTAQMKMFIDRNYWLYTHNIPIKAKSMGLIVIGEQVGMDSTIDAMKKCFGIGSGSEIEQFFVISGIASKVGDVRKNQELISQAREMGERLFDSYHD